MSWNPDQYLKFAAPRFRPALDLLSRITIDSPATVYDLGCGTGSVTRALRLRWPDARLIGVDDSADMLAQAKLNSGELPGVQWLRQSLADWRPDAPADVIYSNAALHWLPDHDSLFPRLVADLKPGGVLAVQMPRNFNAPSHTLIGETIRSGPWRKKLEPLLVPSPVADPAWYYGLLAPLSRGLDIWETEYLQVLEGPDPVKEWTKGTWLKQFLQALEEPQRSAFEEQYARRVAEAYPRRAEGRTLFPFKRLFLVLTKA